MFERNKTIEKKKEIKEIAERIYDAIVMDPEIPDSIMDAVINKLIDELRDFLRTKKDLEYDDMIDGMKECFKV